MTTYRVLANNEELMGTEDMFAAVAYAEDYEREHQAELVEVVGIDPDYNKGHAYCVWSNEE